MFRVIKRFYDLREDHSYSVGDTFPYNGDEIDAERLAELSGCGNKIGVPLIEEIADKPKVTRKRVKE